MLKMRFPFLRLAIDGNERPFLSRGDSKLLKSTIQTLDEKRSYLRKLPSGCWTELLNLISVSLASTTSAGPKSRASFWLSKIELGWWLGFRFDNT